MNNFPQWCIHYEETSLNGDLDSKCEIAVKRDLYEEWSVLYKPNSLLDAQFYIKRLKNLYDPYIKKFLDQQEPIMFEYADQIYKCTYVFPEQSCICGTEILGNTAYGEYHPDGIKVDYLRNTVFFYDKDNCIVKGNKVFLNGELILTSKELVELCDKIGQQFNQLDTYPDKLVKWLKHMYPSLLSYECNGYCCFLCNYKNEEDN